MNLRLFSAVSAIALAAFPRAALAQHQHMPGMVMPAPAKPAPTKPRATKKAAPTKQAVPAKKAAPAKKAVPAKKRPKPAAEAPLPTTPTDNSQTDHSAMDHSQMDHGAMPMAEPPPVDHSTMDGGSMSNAAPIDPHDAMAGMDHAGHGGMKGALGPYPMQREASGTSWQPDLSEHHGVMRQAGGWTLMGHGVLNLVYDHQGGRRGDDKAFVSGMLMGMAQRPLSNGTIQFKAMVSPDPLMGKSGYPLLLASGETANGTDRLIDRQHPHDFAMELSASVSQSIGANSSLFLYAGLPGEPAFGPPAFMHREAIMDSPEAPISHHWLDSTHISFGVVTGGVVLDRVKLEVSRFNGREPDEHRWNIETGPLDSTAVRLSWNPNPNLSLQGSWGHFTDPEQLEPGVDQKRLSASLLYAREVAPGWKLAGTLAWGRKTVEHHDDDAFVAEASVKHGGWTLFGRGEMTENRELLDVEEHGPAFRVGKGSVGAVRDVPIAEHLSLGLGALVSLNVVPGELAPLYGGRNPLGAMTFLRIKAE